MRRRDRDRRREGFDRGVLRLDGSEVAAAAMALLGVWLFRMGRIGSFVCWGAKEGSLATRGMF